MSKHTSLLEDLIKQYIGLKCQYRQKIYNLTKLRFNNPHAYLLNERQVIERIGKTLENNGINITKL